MQCGPEVQDNFYCPTEGEVLAWKPTSVAKKKKEKNQR